MNLNRLDVLRVWRGAAYVRLPKELQRPTGGCSCDYCKGHPDEEPMWDTLGVPLNGDKRTWTLHAPEWRSTDTISEKDRW